MDDLIKIETIEGELFVESRVFSYELGVEHASTLRMIRRFESKLAVYGRGRFKILPFQTNGGTQNLTVCYLNERQATFLVTLSRNSERAVDLKQKLTDSYFHYRNLIAEKPQLPRDFAESLRMLADQVDKNCQLENKIALDAPKVEFAENVISSDDSIEVGVFAKILAKNGMDIGQNRLFKRLRDKNGLNLLITAEKPMQYAIDNKWLELDPYIWEDGDGKKHQYNKVKITGKGQIYIEKRLRKIFADEARKEFFKTHKPEGEIDGKI
jgi:phage antirepressor YoqD-like protein